jgi:hypothetical protein
MVTGKGSDYGNPVAAKLCILHWDKTERSTMARAQRGLNRGHPECVVIDIAVQARRV